MTRFIIITVSFMYTHSLLAYNSTGMIKAMEGFNKTHYVTSNQTKKDIRDFIRHQRTSTSKKNNPDFIRTCEQSERHIERFNYGRLKKFEYHRADGPEAGVVYSVSYDYKTPLGPSEINLALISKKDQWKEETTPFLVPISEVYKYQSHLLEMTYKKCSKGIVDRLIKKIPHWIAQRHLKKNHAPDNPANQSEYIDFYPPSSSQ